MFIVGQISTEVLIKITGQYISTPPSKTLIRKSVSDESGIEESDLFVYHVSDKSIQSRIINKDDFVIVWGDVPWETLDDDDQVIDSGTNHEITSLDFSVEDNKRIVIFFAVDPDNEENLKQEIIGDGVDFSRVYVKAFLPDLSAIDTSYNEELKIPFKDPDGRVAFSKVTLTNGVGYKDFKTTKYGIWYILSKYNFEGKNAKVYDQKVYDMSVLMDI